MRCHRVTVTVKERQNKQSVRMTGVEHKIKRRGTNVTGIFYTLILKVEPPASSGNFFLTGWLWRGCVTSCPLSDTSVWHSRRFASLHCRHFSPQNIPPVPKRSSLKYWFHYLKRILRRWMCSDSGRLTLSEHLCFCVCCLCTVCVLVCACGVSAVVMHVCLHVSVWSLCVNSGWAVHCTLHRLIGLIRLRCRMLCADLLIEGDIRLLL